MRVKGIKYNYRYCLPISEKSLNRALEHIKLVNTAEPTLFVEPLFEDSTIR